MKRVSVVIPCYNVGSHVTRAVESVLEQMGSKVEIVVVDDGSNEETKSILSSLSPKIDLIIAQSNNGVSAARNIGIEAASGEFIAVLDADDYFEPDFCEKASEILATDKEVKLVTSYCRRVYEGNEIDIIQPQPGTVKDFLQYNRVLGCMFRKQNWIETRGYDENMKEGFEDWEFYIRMLEDGGCSKVLPEVLFNYRMRQGSKTSGANKVKKQLLQYIYLKHKALYIKHFDEVMEHFLNRLEVLERAERKCLNTPDYKLGGLILNPLRKLKRLLN